MKLAPRVLAAIFLLSLFAVPPVRAEDRELLLGTVHAGSLFAVEKIRVKPTIVEPRVILLQGPLHVDDEKPYSPKRYKFEQFVLCNQPYRFRVVRDMFWGSGSTGARNFAGEIKRVPLGDLPHYDLANPKRDEQYLAKYPEDTSTNGRRRVAHAWGAIPVHIACIGHDLAPGDDFNPIGKPFHPTPGVFFDVFPTADNQQLQLFVLDVDRVRIWNGTAKRGGSYWKMDWGNEDKDIERFATPFREAFTVFVRDKDYYFVTESGTIYLARDPGKAKERKVEKLWDGERKPVRTLITDADNDKMYCFVEPAGKDKKDEDRVYFELSAKPEPTPYKLTKIDKPKIDEPLKSVLEYAHVLQHDKKLK